MIDPSLRKFLEQEVQRLVPFEPLLLHFCEALSQALFAAADPKQHPELIALAYWLRSSQVEALRDHFRSLERPGILLVPRGLCFHIAPGNVETLFVYSWILSLLVGNANIVRLPSRRSGATKLLFGLIERQLEEARFAKINAGTLLLSYGHEEEVTAAISASADVRLVWGGDATIRAVRSVAQKLGGKELLFADRYALAAFQASRYLCSDEAKRRQVAERFFVDLFWYDQQACSSPRTLFWIGQKGEILEASRDLYEKLEAIGTARGYELPLSGKLQKLTDLYRSALEMPIRSVERFGRALVVVELDHFHLACRTLGSYGLLFHVELSHLTQLVPLVSERDQTLVYEGFPFEELQQLALALNGRGLDRLVPVGCALQFGSIWDGYDLLAELTHRVVIAS